MVETKVLSVVGARPQFVKAAAVSRAIATWNTDARFPQIQHLLVHTGQHYDYQMSAVFFEELDLPVPSDELEVGSDSHGAQTGEMLKRLEPVLQHRKPHLVVVYGDTNSTLAGALAAVKLHLPVAHVEAGLRSYNRIMPEEVNRIVTDHISSLLLCPSRQAVQNLAAEGITVGVEIVGDLMQDVLLWAIAGLKPGDGLEGHGVSRGGYALATVHRAENTDSPVRLAAIIEGLRGVADEGLPVIAPLHPRTVRAIDEAGIDVGSIRVVAPLAYRSMVHLEANAKVIFTDSGGVQKEAYWLGVPCVTLRDETEWVETLENGWNQLVGADAEKLAAAALDLAKPVKRPPLYGTGDASNLIVRSMLRHLEGRNEG